MDTTTKADEATTQRATKVAVNFGGELRRFAYRPQITVADLRNEAIHAFGIATNPHLLGLFDEQDQELQDAHTLHDAGVRPNDCLVLRPSAVRAG